MFFIAICMATTFATAQTDNQKDDLAQELSAVLLAREYVAEINEVDVRGQRYRGRHDRDKVIIHGDQIQVDIPTTAMQTNNNGGYGAGINLNYIGTIKKYNVKERKNGTKTVTFTVKSDEGTHYFTMNVFKNGTYDLSVRGLMNTTILGVIRYELKPGSLSPLPQKF